jgi:ADP-ribosyl-[dinitrogen reductase] hydrolase
VGALLGLAVGDAIGTTLEFSARDSHPPLTDMIGGGPFDLEPGQWTDDTAMALALADSLLSVGDLNETDLLRRFVDWQETGAYSCTGACFDIGRTTHEALQHWKDTGNPIAGSTDPRSAGNGSLMRLAPVAIRYCGDRDKLANVAARQSAVTHGAAEAVGACVAFADMLADAIEGKTLEHVLRPRAGRCAGKLGLVLRGSWRSKHRADIRSSGYVVDSLEAAIWSVGNSHDFESAVLLAANLGDDADTVAAITGQLAGAVYGRVGVSGQWIGRLAWSSRIVEMAAQLNLRTRSQAFNQ